MAQTLEALFDDATDAAVRSDWERLRAAGLPSQARHTGPSNAPHVTLVVTASMGTAAESAVVAGLPALPFAVTLGGLLCFTGRRSVLARAVVLDERLLRLQADAVTAVEAVEGVGVMPQLRPGHWVPHVTLARGLDPDQLGRAVTLMVGADQPSQTAAALVTVRRWDGDARQEWPLVGGGPDRVWGDAQPS